MTYRAALVRAGLWHPFDTRDPATDETAANVLLIRMEARDWHYAIQPPITPNDAWVCAFAPLGCMTVDGPQHCALAVTRETAICAAVLDVMGIDLPLEVRDDVAERYEPAGHEHGQNSKQNPVNSSALHKNVMRSGAAGPDNRGAK